MLNKTYLPTEIEDRIYREWDRLSYFACKGESDLPPYCIMMPPPNVTGSLHMGHALNSTLQDILTRFRRKLGHNVLWQPGMDHAGIATQMVVERQLTEEGLSRLDLGREKFVERVWEWKNKSGGAISNQLRRLGTSPDWARERFTMDDGLSDAVRKVFVQLYEEGLIYRDKRLVNWDPELHTAISDLEVEARPTDGFLWHFRYPLVGSDLEYISVATTRPETLFGDAAVAVHPSDSRWMKFIGKYVKLPLANREILVVADEYADPEQGSGAVKITPAHDFNDFEVGRRHNLKLINVFDRDAKLNSNVPTEYRGMGRYEARDKVVSEMEQLGLLEKVEPHHHPLPHGDRSGVVVEPWLTDQWFVNAEVLAKPAIEAVESGKIRFVPKQWEKTYFEWMRNIQPWCISRQLWWGHRIPAWFGPDKKIFVAVNEHEAKKQAKDHYGKEVLLVQESDVLDTWFSSGLWPFSTLGWPEDTQVLRTFYPNNALVTGFDIIFFWVARMIMLGMHFMQEVPFRTVYIHALVRDSQGRKMSKSKGNVIDPLELIEKYGADAMRFTLAAMEAQGRDIKLSESRVAGYRNFATKLWNAARFCERNDCYSSSSFDYTQCNQTINQWIVAETEETVKEVTKALESYRFNDASNKVYNFAWGIFCDWFLEFSKPDLNGPDNALKDETRATAAWVLDQILGLLHPFMPFVTEELWGHVNRNRIDPLILSPWPDVAINSLSYKEATDDIQKVIALISAVRAVRIEMNVPPASKIPVLLKNNDQLPDWVQKQRNQIMQIARINSLECCGEIVPKGSIQLVVENTLVVLPLSDIIDVKKERLRLENELLEVKREITEIDVKLQNKKFLSKAPEAIVEKQKQRRNKALDVRANLELALAKVSEL